MLVAEGRALPRREDGNCARRVARETVTETRLANSCVRLFGHLQFIPSLPMDSRVISIL